MGRKVIYLAGGLFSASEREYNDLLAQELERKKHAVILPQRDGFDFTSLHKELASLLPEYLAVPACHLFIFLLDLGIYLERSDIVIANVDEPIDPGTHREMLHARDIGKPVIAVRSDIRSPFGSYLEPMGGMHSFVWFSATHFVRINGSSDPKHPDSLLHERVACMLHRAVTEGNNPLRKTRLIRSTVSRKIQRRADYLYRGITDFKSRKSLELMVLRYQERFEWITKIQPQPI